MRLKRIEVAALLAVVVAATLSATATSGEKGGRETRADLDRVVVEHVSYLLSNRFGPAWARIHPVDRRAVGRRLWEACKRSPDESLAAVRYLEVDVIGSRAVKFSSRLHRRITAFAVTVEVQALLQGMPFVVEGVSHWVIADGRWARLVEQPKLEVYAAGGCPA